MGMRIIEGEELRRHNEVYKRESETQVIIEHGYYDALTLELLELVDFSFQYKSHLFYRVTIPSRRNHMYEHTFLRAWGQRVFGLSSTDTLFCEVDWDYQNKPESPLKTFKEFYEVLNSPQYKEVYITTYSDRVIDTIEYIHKHHPDMAFKDDLWVGVRAIRAMSLGDASPYYHRDVVSSGCIDDLYKDIKMLEMNGQLISATQLLERYPSISNNNVNNIIVLSDKTSHTTNNSDDPLETWFARKPKSYPNDNIVIVYENQDLLYHRSEATVTHHYEIKSSP